MSLDRRRAATIEDVARAAGVSRAAVSKVLRNAYGVSPAMREKVGNAVTELGYRPKMAARALGGRSFSIGIGYSDLGNPFFIRMLSGMLGALATTPYQAVITPTQEGARQGLEALEALIDRQVEGIVAVSPRVAQEEIERIAADTPVVMFGRHDVSSAYDAVIGDDAEGTVLAMEHLAGLGHRRIAHLTVAESETLAETPHNIRRRSYTSFMESLGLAEPVILLTEEGQDPAYASVAEVLRAGADFTAIFAAHDDLAIGALAAVREHRPDISVVGYDDVPIARNPAFGLTTVHQPGFEMGARAVELVLERLAGRSEAVHEVFAPVLCVRTSSFPPQPI
ncbi:LacI family DNA-binding transcriptional regulator [Microbacterium sp. 2FI]|uniref:LacI family DNA-binding transcriptional regulator n=1 Tax=Microbacterium sp. 2FI TaxID=2502193 RepID=UPI0010F98446|nr:LacI family DNA-binding transcriptional regulator [Microbacterium sp. 2FI]